MPVLLITRLTIRSSYVRDVEMPADGSFDTVQFFVPDDGPAAHRIKTFAVDHDIHVHGLTGLHGSVEERVAVLRAHVDRTYADVVARVDVVPVPTLSRQDLVTAGIVDGDVEVAAEAGFAFWNPDGGRYATLAPPVTARERDGLREITYLGGIARFWLPDSWLAEEDADSGGRFYDPDGEAALRLSVTTFDTRAAQGPPVLRLPRKPGERQLDGGTLPNGCEFDVYELDTVEDGEPIRIRYWQIGQVLPGQCRVYLFSYTYPIAAEDSLAADLSLLDRELRRMVPHPEPV